MNENAVQQRLNITDPQVMRALAHPARLAITEYLMSTRGAATATELAEVCGLSPSATSYHLRALAKTGLVEQAPSRGDARERVWRAAFRNFDVDVGRTAGPEARAAEQALLDVFLAREDERTRRWLERVEDEPQEWYDAVALSHAMLLITAEELVALNEEVRNLLKPYRRDERTTDPPEGARVVAVQYRAVPTD